MASITLSILGGAVAGPVGAAIGSAVGAMIDARIVSSLSPTQKQSGPRMADLRVTSSTEGAVIPRAFGKMKLGGNIIWATDFTETSKTTTEGGKGGGGGVEVTEYSYFCSFAVAICEGPISGIGRMWADGKIFDPMPGTVYRVHLGGENQTPDPHIVAKTGDAPAYRGVAYVVFEKLAMEKFGNRIPQMAFEVIRPAVDDSSAEQLIRAVTMIPSTGEYVYGTTQVTRGTGGDSVAENVNAKTGVTDFLVSLDDLESAVPNIESVSLVVSWFGDDLRAGACNIRPGVEDNAKVTSVPWKVDGISRASAYEVSQVGGSPVFGGTPSDAVVVQAIREMKDRGLRVTFYPFILMDIPAGNTLPNPYSNGAGGSGQAVYPWRGRITCSPAAGYTGTVDKTAAAATQVSAFFGSATAGDFAVSGTTVSWTGGSDWGYRRMVLHYAHLCAAAGGVDTFLIASELRGLTQVRSGASTYPAVTALKTLVADVRAILGPDTKISYAADWSEYFGHHPSDGSGDVFFHLDPLWSDADVDFVGIDNYLPLSDWRSGGANLDAALATSIYDLGYLQGNIEGGEGYDWYYADQAARDAQTRSNITDGAYSKPWVFRPKDVRNWWSHQHYNRPGGVQSGSPTGWAASSKPIRFTEAGCPAVDKGTNQPNVFYDPKSSESFLPFYSSGAQDDLIQRRFIEALLQYWGEPSNNPTVSYTIRSVTFSGQMIDTSELAIWTWDARPYPAFPALSSVWGDADNWRLGHWLTGRLGMSDLAAVVRELCLRSGIPSAYIDTSRLAGTVSGYLVSALDSARGSIEPLQRFFGFDATETGGMVTFVPRGESAVAAITQDGLVAGGEESGDDIRITRSQETELPRALKWRLVNSEEEYGGITVEARRTVVDTARIVSENFDIAAPGYAADTEARRALLEEWVAREATAFVLPPSRLALDPTDVVSVEIDGRNLTFQISRIADGEGRSIEAKRVDSAVYALPPGPTRPVATTPVVVLGPPDAELMNLPQLTSAMDPLAAYGAVYARPWWGKVAFQRALIDGSWSTVATTTRAAVFGALVDPLPAGPLHLMDYGNTVLVDMPTAELESVSDLMMLSGVNGIAIESSPGLWEIVQFATATLVSAGRWRLSRLLRGQIGTEDAMGAPAAVGSRVVLLDAGLAPLILSLAEIGTDDGWRVLPATALSGDPAITPVDFDHTGRGLRPFSPAHAEGVFESDGSVSMSWMRRSRDPAADNWELTEVPMEEASELYRLQIMNGIVVKRSVDLPASVSSFSYDTTMQTADWGAPVTSVTWRVAQFGQLGPGAWARTTTTI